jgi:hypothetical protein
VILSIFENHIFNVKKKGAKLNDGAEKNSSSSRIKDS